MEIRKYVFIYWLRCIAVCCILYDHLGGLRNPNWVVVGWIERVISRPLHIIQFFGAFSVSIFFIISGFLIDTKYDSRLLYIWNKIRHIILPLVTATVSFFVFTEMVKLISGQVSYWNQFSATQWIYTATLFCYVRGDETYVNGAVWYLFPLMTLYFIVCVFYKTVKRKKLNLVVIVNILNVVVYICHVCGENILYQQMRYLTFLIMPMFGVLIRCLSDNEISIREFGIGSVINYIILIKNFEIFRPEYYEEEPYAISLIYALFLFGILFALERTDNLNLSRPVFYISELSYFVYLTHMTYGSAIMSKLENNWPFTRSFIVATAVVFLVAYIHYYLENYLEKHLKRYHLNKKRDYQ